MKYNKNNIIDKIKDLLKHNKDKISKSEKDFIISKINSFDEEQLKNLETYYNKLPKNNKLSGVISFFNNFLYETNPIDTHIEFNDNILIDKNSDKVNDKNSDKVNDNMCPKCNQYRNPNEFSYKNRTVKICNTCRAGAEDKRVYLKINSNTNKNLKTYCKNNGLIADNYVNSLINYAIDNIDIKDVYFYKK